MPETPQATTAGLLRAKHRTACGEAMAWAVENPDPHKAWAECRRGDWMLWLLGQPAGPPESEGRKKLVIAACECARLALPHTKDERVQKCIETAERWAKGKATIEELRVARAAAAAADAYAAAASARAKLLSKCAAIIRRYYPEAPL